MALTPRRTRGQSQQDGSQGRALELSGAWRRQRWGASPPKWAHFLRTCPGQGSGEPQRETRRMSSSSPAAHPAATAGPRPASLGGFPGATHLRVWLSWPNTSPESQQLGHDSSRAGITSQSQHLLHYPHRPQNQLITRGSQGRQNLFAEFPNS